ELVERITQRLRIGSERILQVGTEKTRETHGPSVPKPRPVASSPSVRGAGALNELDEGATGLVGGRDGFVEGDPGRAWPVLGFDAHLEAIPIDSGHHDALCGRRTRERARIRHEGVCMV